MLFIAAGWRSRQPSPRATKPKDDVTALLATCPIPGGGNGQDQTVGDVADCTRIALKRLESAISAQDVHFDIAVRPGLIARMRSAVLTDILEELITLGIQAAPGAMLLLTASVRGDRIHISLSDDVTGGDVATRQARVRGLTERIALRGGSLDLVVRPDVGTTMTLRLGAALAAVAEIAEADSEAEFVMSSSGGLDSVLDDAGRYS